MAINYKMLQARSDAGLTQKAAAELLGVSREVFNAWENGRVPTPRPQMVALLSKLAPAMAAAAANSALVEARVKSSTNPKVQAAIAEAATQAQAKKVKAAEGDQADGVVLTPRGWSTVDGVEEDGDAADIYPSREEAVAFVALWRVLEALHVAGDKEIFNDAYDVMRKLDESLPHADRLRALQDWLAARKGPRNLI